MGEFISISYVIVWEEKVSFYKNLYFVSGEYVHLDIDISSITDVMLGACHFSLHLADFSYVSKTCTVLIGINCVCKLRGKSLERQILETINENEVIITLITGKMR